MLAFMRFFGFLGRRCRILHGLVTEPAGRGFVEVKRFHDISGLTRSQIGRGFDIGGALKRLPDRVLALGIGFVDACHRLGFRNFQLLRLVFLRLALLVTVGMTNQSTAESASFGVAPSGRPSPSLTLT